MKRFLTLASVFLIMFLTSACTADKPAILFNKYPITEDTVMGYGNLFKPNTRIYYLVLLPEKILHVIFTFKLSKRTIKKAVSATKFITARLSA